MALRKHALKSRACVAPALQPRSERFGKSEVGLTHAQIASRQLPRATVGYEVEADLGTFRERRKASPRDRRDMDEHILAAVIRLNKTIAFRGFEPLHRTHCHFSLSSIRRSIPEPNSIAIAGRNANAGPVSPAIDCGKQPEF